MLHEFLTRERSTIIELAKQKALEWQNGRDVPAEIETGWGLFYDELIELMQRGEPIEFNNGKQLHSRAADSHGREYLRLGFTISEVVYSYGAICQAVTSSAVALDHEITAREFQQLNLSLDTAIAEAVTAFDRSQAAEANRAESYRLGTLAQDLRNCIEHVTIALEMIESGNVGIRSNTARVMHTNLDRMTKVVDTALADIRLRSEPNGQPKPTRIFAMMSEIGVTASYEARARNIALSIRGSHELEATVDRHLLASAVSNLLQNALKFSDPGSHIEIRAREESDRLIMEIEDECGGISQDKLAELLSGTGAEIRSNGGYTSNSGQSTRGIALTRRTVERMGGSLNAKELTGKGCIFTIDLPLIYSDAIAEV